MSGLEGSVKMSKKSKKSKEAKKDGNVMVAQARRWFWFKRDVGVEVPVDV